LLVDAREARQQIDLARHVERLLALGLVELRERLEAVVISASRSM
jgi:hypothetical protein